MTPTKPDEISMAVTLPDQSRREALQKFGRYAAVAPAAMVLLQPRDSYAGKSRGDKGRKGGDSHY
jgi:hypothetical protein